MKPIIKFCDTCHIDVETIIIERPATYTFKGETFEITEKVMQCAVCKEDIYNETLDSQTMSTLVKLYSEKVGISLDEIKSIRSNFGLSMDLFAKILGWSKSTIVRYESGKYIPDSSHLTVLKQLRDKPDIIDEYYKMNAHRFTEKERRKIEEKLKNLDQITVEQGLVEALNINYKLHEKTIDSGYNNFSLEKLIHMILYFTKHGVQKTKLMKLLFYSDFLNFKRNLVSMSGTPYVKLPYGPVPKDHDLLLSSLEKNNVIDINYEFINEYTIININSKLDFNSSLFDEDEIRILEEVKEEFKRFGSGAISEFSHKEDGWKYTEDREIISYDYADSLQLD
ncbi:type II TA system antitoxin MqsA family protein [Bacillus nitroreducens]